MTSFSASLGRSLASSTTLKLLGYFVLRGLRDTDFTVSPKTTLVLRSELPTFQSSVLPLLQILASIAAMPPAVEC